MTYRSKNTTGPAVASQARRIDPPWMLISALVAIYACAFVDRNVLALLVDPIRQSLGVSDVAMSMLLGFSFVLFYSILSFPAGIIVDRFDRRLVIALAAIFWSVMTVVCGLATSYWQIFAGRMGVGFAKAFITSAAFSLIRDRVPLAKQGGASVFSQWRLLSVVRSR